jgi:c-di-GMP-related signal transduction protein
LLQHQGTFDALLSLTIAYEHGEWTVVGDRAARLGLSSDAITAAYLDALAWTEKAVDVGL